MLTNRKMYISTADEIYSVLYAITEGLLQGTVVSPVMFNIYTSDILLMPEIQLDDDVGAIAFADDLSVYCTGKSVKETSKKLQKVAQKVVEYYDMWLLNVNPDKCKAILFRNIIDKITKKTEKVGESLKYQ